MEETDKIVNNNNEVMFYGTYRDCLEWLDSQGNSNCYYMCSLSKEEIKALINHDEHLGSASETIKFFKSIENNTPLGW